MNSTWMTYNSLSSLTLYSSSPEDEAALEDFLLVNIVSDVSNRLNSNRLKW